MNQTVLINLAIIALVALGLILTGNPLFVLALLLMPQLPYGLAQEQMRMNAMLGDNEDDFPAQPVGFTQDVKSKR
jgi:hypothetical protein